MLTFTTTLYENIEIESRYKCEQLVVILMPDYISILVSMDVDDKYILTKSTSIKFSFS